MMAGANRYLALILLTLTMLIFAACSSRSAHERQASQDCQSQLAALQTPQGVDPVVFAQLKDELARQLAARGKNASAPPTGDANAPANVHFADEGGGNYSLHWEYRNIGDYDQNGTVGVTDITPLAIHFNHDPGTDGLDIVLHPSGVGKVGISDVTAIAMNFGVLLDAYDIESSTNEGGPFSHLAYVTLDEATGGTDGWKTFVSANSYSPVEWYRITPNDDAPIPGQSCAPLQIGISGDPPVITGVQPRIGDAGTQIQPVATYTGYEPVSFEWNFGGGATPNNPTESSPLITLGAVGSYPSSVTLTNAFGTNTYNFSLDIMPVWARHYIVEGSDLGAMSSADMTDTGPAVAYIDSADGAIYYAHSTVSLPSDSEDWVVTRAANDQEYAACSFAWVNHLPNIAASPMAGLNFFYMYSLMVEPADESDWEVCKVNSSDVYSYGDITSCFNAPGLSYYTGDMLFAEPTAQFPTSEAQWLNTTVESAGNVGFNSRIHYIDGKLYITYRLPGDPCELHLAWVDYGARTNTASWKTMIVDTGLSAGYWSDLAWDEDANLLIAYTVEDDNGFEYLMLAYCPMEPAATGDFTTQILAQEPGNSVGYGASVAFGGGYAFVFYGAGDNKSMILKKALYTPGTTPAVWETELVDYGLGAVYGRTSMFITATDIMVVYHRNSGLAFASRPL